MTSFATSADRSGQVRGSSVGLLGGALLLMMLHVTAACTTVRSADGESDLPTISGVEVLEVTPTTAKITWTIDRPATGQVEYGTTIDYGLLSILEPSFEWATHVQVLSGLHPDTDYHFRTHSVDEAGNEVYSDDHQFTTRPASELPVFAQPVADMFGSAIGADNLNNAIIGGPDLRSSSFRFRATESSDLKSIVVYILDENYPGYGSGTGGSLRVSVRPDDGSRDNAPGERVLAETTLVDPDDGPGVVIPFPEPPRLVKGQLYHVVFENVDPDPNRNYVSVDGLFVYEEQAVWQPAFPNRDWAHLVRVGGGAWSSDRGPGRGTITPIMALNYANGQHGGVGYMEVWYREPQTISGDKKVREIFTLGGKDRKVSSAAVRLKRVSGSGPLTISLKNAKGRTIASGKVPAARISLSSPDTDGGSTWASVDFSEFPELMAGESYVLVMSAPQDTEYSIFAIREGASHGYEQETYLATGTAEFDDGSGWKPFVGFGTANPQGDLQFYLRDAPANTANES